MSYGLIYTVPFADISNIPCVVEIEKEDYVGTTTELTAGSNPFVVKIDDEEFMYTPIRFSDATIRVVGGDSLQSLFATSYQEYRVTFKKNGTVRWCGFIKPELYTQDYSSSIFELEIECLSGLSTLAYISYEKVNSAFVSMKDLIKTAINESNSIYNKVYIPLTYYNAERNIMLDVQISNNNFVGENGDKMTYKEIIEEICKIYGLTCVEYGGSIYFVDVDTELSYAVYNSDMTDSVVVESPNIIKISDIGYRGSNHTLDIIPGYNKAIVKAVNYKVKDAFNDKDKTTQLYSNLYHDDKYNKSSRVNYLHRNDRCIAYIHSFPFNTTEKINLLDYKDKSEVLGLFGAMPIEFCNYGLKLENGLYEPDIDRYSYTEGIHIRLRSSLQQNVVTWVLTPDYPIYHIEIDPLVYSNAVIGISGSIKPLSDKNISPIGDKAPWLSMEAGILNALELSVRIGDKWWDGNKWVDSEARTLLSYDLSDINAEYMPFKNERTLNDEFDILGNIIPIKDMTGKLTIDLYPPDYSRISMQNIPYGLIIKDLKVSYAPRRNDYEDGDRIYENVVNDKYINECDEIELKMHTHNEDGECWSKLILDNTYVTDNVFSAIEGKNVRLEEALIRRIIKRYGGTKIKLTQVIKDSSDITPITRLSDNFMYNRKFIVTGGEIDYVNETFTCVMTEL